MAPEPAPKHLTLRQASLALLTVIAVVITAWGLGWVSPANLLDQVLAEGFVLACTAVVMAYRYKPK
jgi:hypothetical protein